SFSLHPPTSPALFPYTTLFRSLADFRAFARTARGHPASFDRPGIRKRGRRARSRARRGRPARRLRARTGRGGGRRNRDVAAGARSEEHTSELQSRFDLVCRLLL